MRAARIHDGFVRATLHNIVETTGSASRPKMPPLLRHENTFLAMATRAALIAGAVALALYVASRITIH